MKEIKFNGECFQRALNINVSMTRNFKASFYYIEYKGMIATRGLLGQANEGINITTTEYLTSNQKSFFPKKKLFCDIQNTIQAKVEISLVFQNIDVVNLNKLLEDELNRESFFVVTSV